MFEFDVIGNSGWGDYAVTNDFIVLFPQAAYSAYSNPTACWDFGGWGVSDF